MTDEEIKALAGDAYTDGMTVEEALKAVAGSRDELASKSSKYKASIDKLTSENKNYKDTINASRTDAEKKEAETEELIKQLKTENESFRLEKTRADYKARFLAEGYDEASASKAGDALASGDMEAYFKVSSDFLKSYSEKVLSRKADSTKAPEGSADPDKVSDNDFANMDYQKRLDLYEKNPEAYRRLSGQKK